MFTPNQRGKLIAVCVGLVIVIGAAGLLQSNQPLLNSLQNRLEWLTYDLRMAGTLPKSSENSSRVVIIDIDEDSLRNEGRWPWSRLKVGQLIKNLFDSGVVVVGTDVVFAEPERNPASEVTQWLSNHYPQRSADLPNLLKDAAASLDGDRHLARELEAHDVVLGYTFKEGGENQGALGKPLVIANPALLDPTPVIDMHAYIGNLAVLQRPGVTGGFFTVFPDTDGVIRRCPMIARFDGKYYPSLSLEIARLYLLLDGVDVKTTKIGDEPNLESISLGNYTIPTDGRGVALVPYLGPAYSFRYISATDVLNNRIDKSLLRDTIAILGSSAKGLFDLRTTPLDPLYPGVEVHANLIAGILDQRFTNEPRWADGANLTIVVVLGTLLSIWLPYTGAARLVLISGTAIAALIGLNLWLWIEQNLVVSITVPVAMIATLGIFNLGFGYFFEARGKHQLKSMFGQYVPPQLVDEISKNPGETGFEGDRREMTVLFSDIRGFTTLSESLNPGELKDLLNRFFTPMTEIIFNQRGTIDKYVGDMIMAFWGAPVKDPDHARHAIEAAFLMLDKLKVLQKEFREAGLPEVNIGIGLNTGIMNVGNMGSQFRRSYTVLGDAVNLGSRLEGLTKYYGVHLIVGETTRKNQPDFLFRHLDRVQVKGKVEPVDIFEPVCHAGEGTGDEIVELDRYHAALAQYYDRNWDSAKTGFESLLKLQPGKRIYEIYLERMSNTDPDQLPPDWNGVFTHTSK